MRIESEGYQIKEKSKIGHKGAWPRSRDLHFKFWDHSDISGTTEDTNLKFCNQINGTGY